MKSSEKALQLLYVLQLTSGRFMSPTIATFMAKSSEVKKDNRDELY